MDKLINIAEYLDSTYLKTADEAGISLLQNQKIVMRAINEAIDNQFACIMIRPDFVLMASERIQSVNSNLKIGTVIDFPLGDKKTNIKLNQAKIAISNGAFDIDFVCDYNAFKRESYIKFDSDIIECTKLCVENNKIAKWIIETGALSKNEIIAISKRITDIIYSKFPKSVGTVFIKTSTGYYGGYGAKTSDVKLIKSVCRGLKIKASGGVANLSDAYRFIRIGVDRIGTSKAKKINDQYLISRDEL